jgi:glycosyltransferase involved in cell wall biosynthesis
LIHSENQNKVCAVIPFYNEETQINFLVSSVSKFVDFIILVNDGSTDNSIANIPYGDYIFIIEHPTNRGKGAALRSGFIKSIEMNFGLTITLDADNQHAPEYIPMFIKELKYFDCVIGSRRKNWIKMPIHRKISNFLTSMLLSLKTGVMILDSQSGYRGFRTEILSNILPDYLGFEAESEMIVKLTKNKYKIGFTDIPTIYGNDDSKMRTISTIIGFIKVLFL